VSGYAVQVGLVLALVVVNALFAGSEMALVTLREGQLRRLEEESAGGRALARLARDPNRFLATIQIGITLAGFLASAAAAVSLAKPLVGPLGFLGGAAEPVAIVLVTVVLTFVTLVGGELAPKRIAMQRAERWALAVARPLDLLATVSRPAVWLLGRASDLLVRAAGADPAAGRDEVTVEEIRDMIASRRDVSAEQQTIISGAFEIAERVLREILVPRRQVVTVAADVPVSDAVTHMLASGHSRVPVVGSSGLDSVVGIAHLRDLFGAEGAVGDRAHEPMYFPETLHVSDALRQLRQRRQQFALVVDEHGDVAGIVTMEDLVEELVGEIYDETDRDVQAVVHEPDGSLVVPGTFPVHDLPDVDVHPDDVEDAGVTTVAGLVLAQLGHLPRRPGEEVLLGSHRAAVLEVSGHAITKVRLSRTAEPRPVT
jgi:putative hemolysin